MTSSDSRCLLRKQASRSFLGAPSVRTATSKRSIFTKDSCQQWMQRRVLPSANGSSSLQCGLGSRCGSRSWSLFPGHDANSEASYVVVLPRERAILSSFLRHQTLTQFHKSERKGTFLDIFPHLSCNRKRIR